MKAAAGAVPTGRIGKGKSPPLSRDASDGSECDVISIGGSDSGTEDSWESPDEEVEGNERMDTPSDSDNVQPGRKPVNVGRGSAQSSRRGACGGHLSRAPWSVGLHVGLDVETSDVEVISIGSTDEDDEDDMGGLLCDFMKMSPPPAVSGRTRSRLAARMSIREARGSVSLSSRRQGLSRNSSLGPRRSKGPKMKKGGCGRKCGIDRLIEMNEKVDRPSEALVNSMESTEKHTKASDLHELGDLGGSGDKSNSSGLGMKNEEVERQSEAFLISTEPAENQKTACDFHESEDVVGMSDDKSNSHGLGRKKVNVDNSEAHIRSMGPTEKPESAIDIHVPEDAAADDKLISSRLGMKNGNAEESDALTSCVGLESFHESEDLGMSDDKSNSYCLGRKKANVDNSEAHIRSTWPTEKPKSAADIHMSEDAGAADDKLISSRLGMKNENVEESEALTSSVGLNVKQKTASFNHEVGDGGSDDKNSSRPGKENESVARCPEAPISFTELEDSGQSDYKSNSFRLRKNEKVEQHLQAHRSSMQPAKKQKTVPDCHKLHNSRKSDGDKLSSSRHRSESDKVERCSIPQKSIMGTVKKPKTVSYKSAPSSGSDHAKSIIVHEKCAPAHYYSRITRKSEFFQILSDIIWKKEGLRQAQRQITKPLPVKSLCNDEEEPVEKSKGRDEMDFLFSMMNFTLDGDQIGPFSCTKSSDSRFKTSQTPLFGRGKHCLTIDKETVRNCDNSHRCEKRPSKKQCRSYCPDKDPKAIDGLQFKAQGSCSNDDFGHSDSRSVWDLIPGIKDVMYPHQIEGLEFMWQNLSGSIILDELKSRSLRSRKDVGGCIISHAPGTGKTRLTLAFLQSYLELFPNSHPVIVAPASLLFTWEDEIKKWDVGVQFHNLNTDLSGKEDPMAVSELNALRLSRNNDSIRMAKLFTWTQSKSILILSYDMFVKLAGESAPVEMRKILLELPGLIILDEGHTPRNRVSQVWKLILKLKTEKRVILSGTPFQNNFSELYNTLCLIRPSVADSIPPNLKRFCQRRPGAKIDEDSDVGVEEMRKLVAPFVNLYKGSILQECLPGFQDIVAVLNPSQLQAELLSSIQGAEKDCAVAGMKRKDRALEFEHKQALISVHPSLALNFEPLAGSAIPIEKLEADKLNPKEGIKTRFLMELLRLCIEMGEKVLIFSQYLKPLDLIALQLSSIFGWIKGKEVLLMIGDLPMSQRQSMIKLFNDPTSEAKVLLASIKACSEGISLVGASRVILLDVVWNPSVEKQAISRAYRLGQKKVVYTYHLIMKGTTEWEKYQRQAHKDRLSKLVFSTSISTSIKESPERKPAGFSDDKILETMTSNPELRDMFDLIMYQPKQSNLVATEST